MKTATRLTGIAGKGEPSHMQLIVNPGQTDEQVFNLPWELVTIGRTEENILCVLHKSLSRRHAQLERDGDRVVLIDLNSKNGTFVNELRIDRHELRAGETFRCGEIQFKLVSTAYEPSLDLSLSQRRSLPPGFTPGSMEELLAQRAERLDDSALRLRRADPLDRTKDKLQVLLKVSQLLSSPSSLDVLLERILDLLLRIMDVSRMAILLVDPSTGRLRQRVARVSTHESPVGPVYSERIVEYVYTQSVAALFSDARLDSRLDASSSVILQSIQASMCAPLKPRDEVLGVLYVDSLLRPNVFREEDLEFFTAFANQAAIAIDNAMRMRRLEQEVALARFFPPATLEKLRTTRGGALETLETEVTVLYCDIGDFAALCSTLAPRQVVELLNDYFPVMADIVFKYDGTLEKHMGAALMAVWGAPFSSPDDADRAVCAAVEMQQALAELNARGRAQGRPELRLHVGLNTGRVAAGNIGSEKYLQYVTMGDATHVASQVCTAAGPGEIYMSATTFERWQDRALPTSPLPALRVTGTQEALSLHRLEWHEQPRGPRVQPSEPTG